MKKILIIMIVAIIALPTVYSQNQISDFLKNPAGKNISSMYSDSVDLIIHFTEIDSVKCTFYKKLEVGNYCFDHVWVFSARTSNGDYENVISEINIKENLFFHQSLIRSEYISILSQYIIREPEAKYHVMKDYSLHEGMFLEQNKKTSKDLSTLHYFFGDIND